MYSSPIHMSSWRQNITYLGLAQKPAHTILHWGPRGPQTHHFERQCRDGFDCLLTEVCCLVIAPMSLESEAVTNF